MPAVASHLGGDAFLVKVGNKTEIWFSHSPKELQLALATAIEVEATHDRTWLFVKNKLFTQGFNLSRENLTPCVRQTKQLDMSSIMKMVQDRQALEKN
ncbi:MAG: hypothetical protein EBT26_09220 [Microbacteriaceae bacterium]|nr:hypothetical protein [Microbacteriaceae bacterium]